MEKIPSRYGCRLCNFGMGVPENEWCPHCGFNYWDDMTEKEIPIMNNNLPRSPEIARNADFKDGYAEGIRDASAIAMKMPLTEAWTEITERISDTNVQAMAWRKIARNADFKDGYAEGIRDASAIAMKMPLTEAWTEITERISDTNVQAMAWRTSMAILKLLPIETNPDIGSVDSETAAAILSNAHHTVQIGTTRHGEEAFESVKDRFAKELLALLSQYPVLMSYARDHDWGIGCGENLQLKLRELAQTEAEIVAAQNVAGVRYD